MSDQTSTVYNLPAWFPKALRLLVIEVACLIVLGGSVRVLNAGLACPDWPLCFGDYVPDFHPQVYLEFVHRFFAGTVTIIVLVLQSILLTRKQVPSRLKILGVFSLFLIASQVALGGLTVLLQLKSGVVAAHLALGTMFFAVLLWISLDLKRAKESLPPVLPAVKSWTGMVMCASYAQVLLGALVASNYAGLACTEFPACYGGQWFPTFAGPAGLHVIHRLGAYTLFLVAVSNIFILNKSVLFLKKQSRMLMGVIFLQILLGIGNVVFHLPPILAILHLAIAVKILYVVVNQFHFATAAPELT